MSRISTAQLQAGTTVLTTGIVGSDFNIPLVRPHVRKKDPFHLRTVRNAVHTGRGMVVWFTDNTKSAPLHGRTAWNTPTQPEEGTLW